VVRGLLVADRVRVGDEGHAKSHQDAGTFDMRTWRNLLTATETMHKEFLDVVKGRAPANDPRMESLSVESDSLPSKRRKVKAKAAPRREKRERRRRS
jgi:hypothetical protein